MAPKKAEKKILRTKIEEPEQILTSSWLDYFRFGESYTSLILGIIVVIITTVLLVFLVRDRNVTQLANRSVSSTNTIDQGNDEKGNQIARSLSVTPTGQQAVAAVTIRPTVKPTVTVVPTTAPTQRPTAIPTKTFVAANPTDLPTLAPTKKINPTAVPTQKANPTVTLQPTKAEVKIAQQPMGKGKTHTVAVGENLWSIAEKYYQSGYNWVDIARVNNVSEPGVITPGTKLSIPDVKAKIATLGTKDVQENYGPAITGSTYTVQKGDHLWGIAVRAYNDGYRWTEIAKVNNITNPSLIYSGVVLKLPRTAPVTQSPK